MIPALDCIEIVETWMRDMRPGGAETAEDAVAELRNRVASMSAEQAHDLVSSLSRVSALSRSAQLLWRQIAVNCDGPAYSARLEGM